MNLKKMITLILHLCISINCTEYNKNLNSVLKGHFEIDGINSIIIDYSRFTYNERMQANEEMIQAIKSGDLKRVKELLLLPFMNIDFINDSLVPSHLPYLSIAITENQEEIVKLFLAIPGIDVNGANASCYKSNSDHPKLAVFKADPPLLAAIKYLERKSTCRKYHVSEQCKSAKCNFSTMSDKKNLEIIKALIAHPDIEVNLKINIYSFYPLLVACYNNDLEVVKLLLNHPRINLNGSNIILLSIAKRNNLKINPAIIKALIYAGAEVKDKHGRLFYEYSIKEKQLLYKKIYEEYLQYRQEMVAQTHIALNEAVQVIPTDVHKMISEYVL